MAEEPIKPNPSPQEVEALKESVRKLEANNKALMEQYGKAMDKAKAIPDDVDVNALIAFKQQKEQEELEAKGRYEEAIAKQAQQFREAEAMQKQQIEKLMAEKRQLEIEAPAVTALADVVHDPKYALSQINREQLEREADGTVVVVDGYNRTPVKEWALSNIPTWAQKYPRPQGSGATTSRVQTEYLKAGEKNPFAQESFNLTEQGRLAKYNVEKFNMLKNAVKG
tara:strand:- start:1497 stop:2171 length:675 start_codon:yes stop_codon:yes gene_type:complete